MLFLLLAWVYIFFQSAGYGLLAINLLTRFRLFAKPPQAPALEIICLSGLCFLSWALSIFHFFSSINFPLLAALLAGAGFSWFFNFRHFREPLKQLKSGISRPVFFRSLLLLFGFLTLLSAEQAPAFPDTGSYHAQFIQWLQQYRIVPGLGNLHGRLAFNSHAHLLAAFFSFPGTLPSPLHQAFGSFLFLLGSCFALRKMFNYLEQEHRFTIFYGGFLVLLFSCFRPWLSSPMPDSAVAIFTFFLNALFLEKIRDNAIQKPGLETGLMVLLLATLISFKLSAVFLVSLLALQLWHLPAKQRGKWLFAGSVIFVLVLLPWLGRNLILSGHLIYPFYPLPGLDLFKFDWKIPPAQVLWEEREIVHFARRPDALWRENLGVPLSGWFTSWFQKQDRISQVLFIGLSFLLVAQGMLLARRNLERQPFFYQYFLALLISCGCWFFTAPAFRFAYGYLISAVLVGLMLFFPEKLPKKWLYIIPVLCLLYAGNGIRSTLKTPELNQAFLWPLPYKQVATNPVKVSKQQILVRPEDGRCWNEPIPCTFKIESGLKFRGPSLQDGFRIDTTRSLH